MVSEKTIISGHELIGMLRIIIKQNPELMFTLISFDGYYNIIPDNKLISEEKINEWLRNYKPEQSVNYKK